MCSSISRRSYVYLISCFHLSSITKRIFIARFSIIEKMIEWTRRWWWWQIFSLSHLSLSLVHITINFSHFQHCAQISISFNSTLFFSTSWNSTVNHWILSREKGEQKYLNSMRALNIIIRFCTMIALSS